MPAALALAAPQKKFPLSRSGLKGQVTLWQERWLGLPGAPSREYLCGKNVTKNIEKGLEMGSVGLEQRGLLRRLLKEQQLNPRSSR